MGLTQAAFARVMGVDRSQVTRWAQNGMPKLPDGTVDPEAAAPWVRANVDDYKLRGSIGARQMQARRPPEWEENLRYAFTGSDEEAARHAAELLLPHLPEATVRAIVAELLRRCRAGSAECLADDVPPPAGCRTWLDHDSFRRPSPDADGWAEIVGQQVAGKLVKVG